MAEEADKEAKESGGGGLGGLLKIIIPIVALLLGAGGGYMAGSSSAAKQVEEAKAIQPEPKAGDVAKDTNAMVGDMYKLEPFVVNLNEPKGSRYLKATIQLEMSASDLKPELDRRAAQLQDVILALLTSKTFQELQSLEGKFRLREELLSRINALLVNGTVARVYFTEFVIQ
ncbi:flagellar basal body-associated FliL family protein [Candidatus Magnetaquicoccus inordinatus]|uniref:flagellar basal body-associated FliL family protein n=1 Tax=Candidatus Magnetaquicoccus inordinatus TaxID=2496818 RepID=UPI00102BEDBD|nr:flagellar basal body-associated FliL family protein [Candidatus Magnetaquicoccus inordinatus]